MVIELIGSTLVLLILFIIHRLFVRPRKILKNYADQLKGRDYRVHVRPYNILYDHFSQLTKKPENQHGDCLKVLKEEYPKYDIVLTNILNKPLIQLCHPDFIKDYYSVDKHYQYPRFKNGAAFISRLAESGIIFIDGKQWKHKRMLFNKVFTFQFLKAQIPNILKVCQTSLENFEKKFPITQNEQGEKIVEYNLLEHFSDTFSRVMLTNFLGIKNNQLKVQGVSLAQFTKKLIDDASSVRSSLLNFLFGKGFLNLGLRKIDRQVNRQKIIYDNWGIPFIKNRVAQIQAELKKNPDKKVPSDVLEAIVMEKLKNQQNKIVQFFPTQKEIFDDFNTFYFGGTDSSAHTAQMIIYFLALNPQCEKRLREDIEKFMSTDDYSYENLKNLKYIDYIQKETTRLYGPVLFNLLRQASEDNYLNGLLVKKGTFVYPLHVGINYSEKYFKNPFEFRPQRWENQCANCDPLVYGGFGGGPRVCIGKNSALLQGKIALILFMKRYKKIILPKKDFKMETKFFPCPEQFKTKLVLSE